MGFKHIIIAVATCAAIVSCKQAPAEGELVAKVNGEGITKADFDKMVERNMARYRGQGHALPPGIETRIKESVLRRMIDDKVIALKAAETSVTIPVEELATKFKEHKDRFRTDQAFQDYLKRSNNTEENMKADLQRNMLRDKVVEKLSGAIDVTTEEVKKYYEDNKQRFIEKEQVKAARILIRPEAKPGQSDADKAKADKKAAATAKDVFKQAAKKDADFGALAQQHSAGPEKNRRGELGWLTRGRMPAGFDNVAFGLELNKISEPVKTRDGYEIIKVSEKREERQRTLENVEENIKNSLLARKRNEKRREVLRNLKKDAQVEHLIKFDHSERPGAAQAARPPLNPAKGVKRPLPGRPLVPGQPQRAGQPGQPGQPVRPDARKPGAPETAPAPAAQPAGQPQPRPAQPAQ